MSQQSQLRISQSTIENEIKDLKEKVTKSSSEELSELINNIVDQKMKSCDQKVKDLEEQVRVYGTY